MAAPITNEPYAEQTSRAFHALKFASPQQLVQAAQAAQSNPQSPEALGLAAATNFQQQQRAAGVQAPQQTVYQRQIAQLLQSMQPPPVPMQGGLAGIGPNVYAAQEAAAMDPMRNAGIGIAPENMPEPQGAATGGLVALAQGGEVPGYAFGKEVVLPESGTAMYPEEEEESDDDAVDSELENETGQPDNQHLVERQNTPKLRTPRDDGEDVHTPAPGSSAAKIARNAALKNSVADMLDIQGPSYEMSESLAKDFQEELKGANRDKWINALTQGIGGMLSAQTPYFGQAAGQGLLAGAAGFQQGRKEESDIRKQLLGIKMGTEKEKHADRRLATKAVMDIEAANTAAKRKRELELDKINATMRGKLGLISAAMNPKGDIAYNNALNDRNNWIRQTAQALIASNEGLGRAMTMEQALEYASRQADQLYGPVSALNSLRGIGGTGLRPEQALMIIGGPGGF
jgi:hypothetical protein